MTVPSVPALQVRDAQKRFGGVAALTGVTLDVPTGQLVGLIGPNGAGKSTLFNAVVGLEELDTGSVFVEGSEVSGLPLHEIARSGVGRTFQAPRGFGSLSVVENLMIGRSGSHEGFLRAFAPSRPDRKRALRQAEAVLDRIGLADLRDWQYSRLSAGQMRLLEIGRQLMRDVRILLLDEPTAGTTPQMQDTLGSLLRTLSGEGMTVVVVEHNLGFVLPLVSLVHVLDRGRVIASGPPADIQRDETVINAYLGGAAA